MVYYSKIERVDNNLNVIAYEDASKNNNIFHQKCSTRTCSCTRSFLSTTLSGVPGGFPRASPVFVQPTYWRVSYELKS